jgi:hypothetical protein
MSGDAAAHGHGHSGPAKVLPPRPELSPKAGLKEKFQHAMWYKRHPDYEGGEAYIRYYLPHNYQVRRMPQHRAMLALKQRRGISLTHSPSIAMTVLTAVASMQIVYATLGTYTAIAMYQMAKSKRNKKQAIRDQPKPTKPDYHCEYELSSIALVLWVASFTCVSVCCSSTHGRYPRLWHGGVGQVYGGQRRQLREVFRVVGQMRLSLKASDLLSFHLAT